MKKLKTIIVNETEQLRNSFVVVGDTVEIVVEVKVNPKSKWELLDSVFVKVKTIKKIAEYLEDDI